MLIPPTVGDLFLQHPFGLRALASRATFAPLRRWLEGLAREDCEIGIHTPGGLELKLGYPSEVFLQVGPMQESGGRSHLLSGGIDDLPARCPPTLAEVLRLVGVITSQYGWSERLVHPSEQESLPTVCEKDRRVQRQLVDEVLPTLMESEEFRRAAVERFGDPLERVVLPDSAHECHVFYKDGGGGWIATNPSGLTFHSGYRPGPPIDEFLATFFERRLRALA